MATTKTLTPTNQTISIPELTDAPDMSVPADAIDKEADAINTLNSRTVAYKKDAGTLAALEADILDFAGNMSVNEVRPYTFWASADFSPFEASKIYEGSICLVASNRVICIFNSDSGNLISVGYNAGTWKFEQLSNKAEKKFQFSTFSAIPTSFVGLTAVSIGNTADPNCPYPTGVTMWWNVIQVGIETRLTQIASQAYSTRPGKDEIWVRSKHDNAWSAWVRLAKNSEVVHYKSVTIAKATAGTSWSQTSRNIGTVSDLFGVADNKLVSAMVYDAGFNPAANATVGTFNGNVFVAATQTTTLSSDVKVRVAYID